MKLPDGLQQYMRPTIPEGEPKRGAQERVQEIINIKGIQKGHVVKVLRTQQYKDGEGTFSGTGRITGNIRVSSGGHTKQICPTEVVDIIKLEE